MPSSQQLKQQAFLSQGATAVIHGSSVRALDPFLVRVTFGLAGLLLLRSGCYYPSGALQWKETKAQLESVTFIGR